MASFFIKNRFYSIRKLKYKKLKLFNKLFTRKTDNIAFIFGAPRSGTTWLWSLLESHCNIIPFVDNAKLNEGIYTTSESGIYIKKPKQAKNILKAFCDANKKSLIIEKTPSHTLRQMTILKDFPNSKSIIILRHPLAIANSMIHSDMHAFSGYDENKAISEIKKYFKELNSLCQKECFMTITYEQLSLNTNDILINMFKYLNLDSRGIDNIVSENSEKTKVGVKGAYRKGKLNSYKEELTEKQQQILKSNLKNEIKFYKEIYLKIEDTYSK